MGGKVYNFTSELEVTLLNPNEKVPVEDVEEDWEIGKHYFRVKTAEAIGKA